VMTTLNMVNAVKTQPAPVKQGLSEDLFHLPVFTVYGWFFRR